MRRVSRRDFVRASGVAGVVATAGCLRTVGGGGADQSSSDGRALTVQHAWGPRGQREVRWEEGKLVVVCGDENPDADDADGESAVGADVAVGTTQPIDASRISRIQYVYRHRSTPGEGLDRDEAKQDVSYFALSRTLVDLSEKRVRYAAQREAPDNQNVPVAVYLKDREDTGRTEREIDVSDLSESVYLGVGANVGSSFPQVVTLEVFGVRGIDESGEEVFRLDAADEALSFE